MKLLLVTLLSLAAYIKADSDKEHWRPEEFPNPIHDVEVCSLSGTSSHMCDPHRYINDLSNANQLDYLITTARDQTECMCSERYCSDVVQTRGVKIGIAIVNKMAPSLLDNNQKYELQGKLDAAAQFAQYLDNTWKLGSCGDTILIFYSVNDHVLFTHTGSATSKVLSNQYISDISMKHRHLFETQKYFEGFGNLISDYKAVMNGKYTSGVQRVERPADPQSAALQDGSSGATLTLPQVLTTVLMLVATLAAHL